jgi:hypothetical protein
MNMNHLITDVCHAADEHLSFMGQDFFFLTEGLLNDKCALMLTGQSAM